MSHARLDVNGSEDRAASLLRSCAHENLFRQIVFLSAWTLDMFQETLFFEQREDEAKDESVAL